MDNHVINVRFFKNGCGLMASCSCGARLGRSTGCNRSGLDYALCAVRSRFITHCEEVSAVPMATDRKLYETMIGLAGGLPSKIIFKGKLN